MAATGYTPISLYYSTTASAVPTAGNLANGELALNIADMKLYAKNSAGTVTLLASNASTTGVDSLSFGSTGLTPSTATTGAITVAGTLNVANGGTGKTSYTANGVLYASGTGTLANGSALTFDGTKYQLGVSGSTGATLASTFAIEDYSSTDQYRLTMNWAGSGKLGIGASTSSGIIFGTATGTSGAVTSQWMCLNSTGLGIGTTSPSTKLTVRGVTFTDNGATGGASGIVYAMSASSGGNFGQIGNTGTRWSLGYGSSLTALGTEVLVWNDSGNVGIGTSSPTAKIETYKSTAGVWAKFAGVNVSEASELNIGTDADDANNTVYIATNNTTGGQRFSIRMGGTTSTYDVASFFNGNGFSVGTTAAPGAGAIYATGAITAYYSDERLKDVKGRITNALAKVRRLSGVYYTNNETAKALGYTSDEMQVGVLANQMKGELPEIVKPAPFDLDEKGNSKSGENYMTVQYERGLPLLIEALKELADQFDDYVATH